MTKPSDILTRNGGLPLMVAPNLWVSQRFMGVYSSFSFVSPWGSGIPTQDVHLYLPCSASWIDPEFRIGFRRISLDSGLVCGFGWTRFILVVDGLDMTLSAVKSSVVDVGTRGRVISALISPQHRQALGRRS